MCDGIVIDAHIMRRIRDELVLGHGPLYDLISWITQNCGIAVSPLIEAHWETKIKDGDFFWTWYASQYTPQSIHRYERPLNLPSTVKKKIRVYYGLPDDLFVIGCIKCANSTHAPRYIMADDIYFHHPPAKGEPSGTQQRIMESRSGALCRYLEKELNIRVGTDNDCTAHFAITRGNCPARLSAPLPLCPRSP